MNVLIVGARGAGKTTLIRRVLESLDCPVWGFETEKEGDQVHIYDAGAEHVPTEENPVIAAVKDRDTAFLSSVRSHPGCRCFFITEENRDALYEEVLDFVKKQFQITVRSWGGLDGEKH